jgi:hypothetical protein
MTERLPKAETGGGGDDECSKPTVERREGERDERSTGTHAEQRAGGLQGISSSERAALLSARIHREINVGRFVLIAPTRERATRGWDGYDEYLRPVGEACGGCALGAAAFALGAELPVGCRGGYEIAINATMGFLSWQDRQQLEDGFETPELFVNEAFCRLGAELRAIVLGNRGTS